MCALKINPTSYNYFTSSGLSFDILKAKSVKAIEKIAENKNMNVYINASENKELMKDKLIIMAMTIQSHSTIRGAARLYIEKSAKPEEMSVKLYNVAMMAIEAFENKLKKL